MAKVTLINPHRNWTPDRETLEMVLVAAASIARSQLSKSEQQQLNLRLCTYKGLTNIAKAVIELDHWVGSQDDASGDGAPEYSVINIVPYIGD